MLTYEKFADIFATILYAWNKCEAIPQAHHCQRRTAQQPGAPNYRIAQRTNLSHDGRCFQSFQRTFLCSAAMQYGQCVHIAQLRRTQPYLARRLAAVDKGFSLSISI